jgi:acetyltransferase-like isoleucine patch superfamily enzyme
MCKLGLDVSEKDYGGVTLFGALGRAFRVFLNSILLKYCMYSVIFSPFNYRIIRPIVWRWMGVKIGKRCYIGYEVYIDIGHCDMICIEDRVRVANRCFILCHQRDLSDYCIGDDITKLKYRVESVHLRQGCFIGSGTTILPGVTIGEGSVIGAGSLVTHDIPAWTVAVGRPAKVVKYLPERKA